MNQKMIRCVGLILTAFFVFCEPNVWAASAEKIPAHDPSMIRENDTFYVFCTGGGITVWSSKGDMNHWKAEPSVFQKIPAWVKQEIPAFEGNIWAPDISYFRGQYYLYYAVSAFGKNTSAIGVATNKTLNPHDPDFKWVDHGKVVESYPGKTNWNAIDPNLVLDEHGQPYLVFGSFWNGLKLVRLAADGFSIDDNLNEIPTIASRKSDPNAPNPPAIDDNPPDAGGNAIEAPFIFKANDYYYLFASIDYCCKGPLSTYKIIVGRSSNLYGPYLDEEGNDMATGGGTLLLKGNEDWYAVGHNAAIHVDGRDYILFHGYDAHDEGRSKLIIRKLNWNAAKWPVVKL